MKIYVVRHAQTDWNAKKRMQGSTDIPLNKTGIKQAAILRKKISNVNIYKPYDIIFCSPLSRTLETAKIINETFNKDILIDERLKERDFGEFEGIYKGHFDYNKYWDFNLNKTYQSAENIQDLYNRVVGFLNEIKQKYNDKTILISTHGGVCKIINYYISNNTYNNGKLAMFTVDNCQMFEYDI